MKKQILITTAVLLAIARVGVAQPVDRDARGLALVSDFNGDGINDLYVRQSPTTAVVPIGRGYQVITVQQGVKGSAFLSEVVSTYDPGRSQGRPGYPYVQLVTVGIQHDPDGQILDDWLASTSNDEQEDADITDSLASRWEAGSEAFGAIAESFGDILSNVTSSAAKALNAKEFERFARRQARTERATSWAESLAMALADLNKDPQARQAAYAALNVGIGAHSVAEQHGYMDGMSAEERDDFLHDLAQNIANIAETLGPNYNVDAVLDMAMNMTVNNRGDIYLGIYNGEHSSTNGHSVNDYDSFEPNFGFGPRGFGFGPEQQYADNPDGLAVQYEGSTGSDYSGSTTDDFDSQYSGGYGFGVDGGGFGTDQQAADNPDGSASSYSDSGS